MSDRRRVLVVDDEPDVRLLCRVHLEFEGHTVLEAADGMEALAMARNRPVDIILLDVMMPRMDGWQVLAELQEDVQLRDIPVVMLTAKVQEADQVRGWTSGAADYVTKPFSPLALSRAVQVVLEGGQAGTQDRRERMLAKLRLMHRDEEERGHLGGEA